MFDIWNTFYVESDIDNERGKFLSRVFGIFSEEIVRKWCNNSNSEYDDLGRPILYRVDEKGGKQLDFTFKNKNTGKVYVGELKCELEYQNYKYLELKEPKQLIHHTSEKETDYNNRKKINWDENNAFDRFLKIAKNPSSYKVKVGGKETPVNGSILVWGCVTEEGRSKTIEEFGLYDILSLEDMINDLIRWKDDSYNKFIQKRYKWMSELMSSLGV